MRSQIRHQTVVIRDGRSSTVNVPALVPGDFIELRLGDIVPADVRLVEVTGLECDESVLTGESLPADKNTDPVPVGTALAEGSSPDRVGLAVSLRGVRGVGQLGS